jgi:hypothetical protein
MTMATPVRRPRGILFALSFLFWLAAKAAFGAPNATITNGDVHLRKSYPTFGVSTLLKFRLTPGESLAVIPKGTRIEILSKRIVAKKYEWFEAIYVSAATQLKGWIYAGEVGNRRYVALDPGVEGRLPTMASSGRASSTWWQADASVLPFVTLQAQQQGVVEEPEVKTGQLQTVLFGLAYVVIFLGSLLAIKKWIYPSSNLYSFLTSMCILLILGFLSQSAFADIIGQMLTSTQP